MSKKKPKLQYRHYEMETGSQVLALLGEEWRRQYGQGIEELHFHLGLPAFRYYPDPLDTGAFEESEKGVVCDCCGKTAHMVWIDYD